MSIGDPSSQKENHSNLHQMKQKLPGLYRLAFLVCLIVGSICLVLSGFFLEQMDQLSAAPDLGASCLPPLCLPAVLWNLLKNHGLLPKIAFAGILAIPIIWTWTARPRLDSVNLVPFCFLAVWPLLSFLFLSWSLYAYYFALSVVSSNI